MREIWTCSTMFWSFLSWCFRMTSPLLIEVLLLIQECELSCICVLGGIDFVSCSTILELLRQYCISSFSCYCQLLLINQKKWNALKLISTRHYGVEYNVMNIHNWCLHFTITFISIWDNNNEDMGWRIISGECLTVMGDHRGGRDHMVPMQSVSITTNVISSNPAHGEVYSIQLYDKVCKWFAAGPWVSRVSITNDPDRHDITKIMLKVALIAIALTLQLWWNIRT